MNAQNAFNTNSEQLFQQGGSKWNLDRISLVLAVSPPKLDVQSNATCAGSTPHTHAHAGCSIQITFQVLKPGTHKLTLLQPFREERSKAHTQQIQNKLGRTLLSLLITKLNNDNNKLLSLLITKFLFVHVPDF